MAICRYHLSLLPDSQFLSLDSDLLATAMGATGSAWQKRRLHLSMLSTICSMCWTSLCAACFI